LCLALVGVARIFSTLPLHAEKLSGAGFGHGV